MTDIIIRRKTLTQVAIKVKLNQIQIHHTIKWQIFVLFAVNWVESKSKSDVDRSRAEFDIYF